MSLFAEEEIPTISDCRKCKQYLFCKSPKMVVEGEGHKEILIVKNKVSEFGDEDGLYHYEQTLWKTLEKYNIDIEMDCWMTSAIICYTEKITKGILKNCKENLINTIKELKPKLVILIGENSIQNFIGDRFVKEAGKIGKWRGFVIPDQTYKTWVLPVYDFDDDESDKVRTLIFERDIENALCKIDEVFPDIDKEIEVIQDIEKISAYLYSLLKRARKETFTIAIDYETTGLKPYNKIHKIKTVAVSDGIRTVAFPNKFPSLFAKILKNPNIEKVLQNAKFENIWSLHKFGTRIKNVIADTQLNTHILDNRRGITGLKFQAYVRFGVIDYSSHIEKYLKSEEGHGNAVNTIDKAPIWDLLYYNGKDALFTIMLHNLQVEEFKKNPKLKVASDIYHEGLFALNEIENNGINIDLEYCHRMDEDLQQEIDAYLSELNEYKEIKLWKKVYKDEFNLDSDKQTQEIVYKRLKYKAKKFTDKGSASTDEEALRKLNVPFLNVVLKLRKIMKAKNTFLAGIIKETSEDGLLHPFFNLHTTVSYRSSSQNLNFQNLPIRDKKIGKIIRNAFIPRKGNQLCELDFSGIEVRVSCFYNQDKKLLYDVIHGDMHRDMAGECYKISAEDMQELKKDDPKNYKMIRYSGKSGFVFPEFYGDYYENIAKSLWAYADEFELMYFSDITIKEHMETQGIRSYKQFEDHIQKVEYDFWNKRYVTYKKWKDKWYKQYQKDGYVENLLGFKYIEYMNKRQAINYPIQGLGFLLLLWCLNKLSVWLKENKYETLSIGQIHDSILLDIVPEERDVVLKKAKHIMEVEIMEFDFINIPIEAEIELCKIDESWFYKEEIKI